MKVHSGIIVVSVLVAAGKAFHSLNLAPEAFAQGIGYPVPGIGYHIVDIRFQALGGLDDRAQPRLRSPQMPERDVSPHPTFFMILPEVTEGGYQLKPGHFVNSTGYLRMIFYPFLPVVSHPSGLLSIQTGLGSLSQIIVQLLLFHRVSLCQSYE